MSSAKALGPLGLIEFAQALDDRFLGRKIAVEIARAHAGFVGDMLHRRRMKAMADEGALGRFQDSLAPLGVGRCGVAAKAEVNDMAEPHENECSFSSKRANMASAVTERYAGV